MVIRKIPYDEAAYIRSYKNRHWFEKWCCNWYIREEDGYFKLYCRIKWPVFIVIYVPVTIIDLCWCAWSCGIKYFTPEPRTIHDYSVNKFDRAYERMLEYENRMERK